MNLKPSADPAGLVRKRRVAVMPPVPEIFLSEACASKAIFFIDRKITEFGQRAAHTPRTTPAKLQNVTPADYESRPGQFRGRSFRVCDFCLRLVQSTGSEVMGGSFCFKRQEEPPERKTLTLLPARIKLRPAQAKPTVFQD